VSIEARWRSAAPYILSVLRIVAALMFLSFGTMILFGWPTAMPGGNSAPVMSQTWVGGWLEFAGGVLLALGLCTRPTAFILSGMMAVAYFQFHAPHGPWPAANMGTPAILYCFLWLYFSAAGAGVWSLDALLGKQKAAPS